MSRRCLCCSFGWLLFILGLLSLVLGLVLQFAILPTATTEGVNNGKVLGTNDDGTLNAFTSAWANNAYLSYTEFYVYSYANVIGIMNRGSFPDVDLKGPYTYKTTLTNEIRSWENNQTIVNYYQRYLYEYDASRSCEGCDPLTDTVLTPDIIYQLIVNMLPSRKVCTKVQPGEQDYHICQNISVSTLDNMNKGGLLFSLLNIEPFINVTVDQLLFSGYHSPISDSLKEAELIMAMFNPDDPPLPLGEIGEVLKNVPVNYMLTNNTIDFSYRVETGKDDPTRSGFVLGFNSSANSSYPSSEGDLLPTQWWNPVVDDRFCPESYAIQARFINGTIGDYFASFIERTDKIPIYVSDICRTVTLSYLKDVQVKGIDAYRFVFDQSVFNSDLPSNCGFCTSLPRDFFDLPQGSRCLPSGFLDMSGCVSTPFTLFNEDLLLKIPIVASLPHFYQTDPRSAQFLPRFKPNEEDDATTLDVEPITGTLLAANKRMQINLFIGQSDHTTFDSLSVQRSGPYPVFFLNQTALIDDNSKEMLTSSLAPLNIMAIISYVLYGIGGVLIIISIIMLCCSSPSKNEKKE